MRCPQCCDGIGAELHFLGTSVALSSRCSPPSVAREFVKAEILQ